LLDQQFNNNIRSAQRSAHLSRQAT